MSAQMEFRFAGVEMPGARERRDLLERLSRVSIDGQTSPELRNYLEADLVLLCHKMCRIRPLLATREERHEQLLDRSRL